MKAYRIIEVMVPRSRDGVASVDDRKVPTADDVRASVISAQMLGRYVLRPAWVVRECPLLVIGGEWLNGHIASDACRLAEQWFGQSQEYADQLAEALDPDAYDPSPSEVTP